MLGHWVMKAANHTSEILIRTLGRAVAVTLAVLLGLPSTLKTTHVQFTPLRNHYSSVETDTAITWKARKTPLQTVIASLPGKATYVLWVCAVMHVCLYSGEWDCATLHVLWAHILLLFACWWDEKAPNTFLSTLLFLWFVTVWIALGMSCPSSPTVPEHAEMSPQLDWLSGV